jgi:uncharacterized protein YutE (UPF0331/DUF86 family)
MTFQDYLVKTVEIATEEKTILDELSSKMSLNKIEFRAAKSSLQTLIENAIGKAKKILKYYGCPVTPSRGRDAIFFMYELGLIEEEEFQALNAAIGFRNSMIHDYMKFDESVLYAILREKRYMDIYRFLIEIPEYNETLKKRITTFTV